MPIKKKTFGSRGEVYKGLAIKTSGNLRKLDLKLNKNGKIVSKKKSNQIIKRNKNNKKRLLYKGGNNKENKDLEVFKENLVTYIYKIYSTFKITKNRTVTSKKDKEFIQKCEDLINKYVKNIDYYIFRLISNFKIEFLDIKYQFINKILFLLFKYTKRKENKLKSSFFDFGDLYFNENYSSTRFNNGIIKKINRQSNIMNHDFILKPYSLDKIKNSIETYIKLVFKKHKNFNINKKKTRFIKEKIKEKKSTNYIKEKISINTKNINHKNINSKRLGNKEGKSGTPYKVSVLISNNIDPSNNKIKYQFVTKDTKIKNKEKYKVDKYNNRIILKLNNFDTQTLIGLILMYHTTPYYCHNVLQNYDAFIVENKGFNLLEKADGELQDLFDSNIINDIRPFIIFKVFFS